MNTMMALIGMHLLILAVFYLFYRLVLSRDTFFHLNRWTLIIGLLASVILPFFRPSYLVEIIAAEAAFELAPVDIESSTTDVIPGTMSLSENIWRHLLLLYSIIALFFLVRFIWQVVMVAKEAKSQNTIFMDDVKLVNSKKHSVPFSFFNLVFIDLEAFGEKELKKILVHERAHIVQKHWLDLLLIQLFRIVGWINPLLKSYEAAIKQNHEYLADAAVLQKGFNRRQYQMFILRQMLAFQPVPVANHLLNQHHKNRFQMMNQTNSKQHHQFKVLAILPFLALILWAFAKPVPSISQTVMNDTGLSVENQSTSITGELMVKGSVVDIETKKPIASANVIIARTTFGTITDEEGNFIIKMKADSTLAISYMGYQTVRLKVSDESPLNIQLAPKYKVLDLDRLPEKPAEPKKAKDGEIYRVVEDLPYYKKDLKKEIEFAIQKQLTHSAERGTVNMHFTITKEGHVENIYVKESSNPKLNKATEAIISKLKDWEPGKQRDKKVDTRMSLLLKFE